MNQGKEQIRKLTDSSRSFTKSQQTRIDGIKEQLRSMEERLAPLLREKKECDRLLPRHEASLENEFEAQSLRDHAHKKYVHFAHYGELFVACSGTILWAYGDLIFH
jgi:TolA-binding protein